MKALITFNLIAALTLASSSPAAHAQEFSPEGADMSAQTDITNGMAERNASYAGQVSGQSIQAPPEACYQSGYSAFGPGQLQRPAQAQSNMPIYNNMPIQGYAQQYQGQMQANSLPGYESQGYCQQQSMPGQSALAAPNSCQSGNGNAGGASTGSAISNLASGMGMQVAGALGAALMLNYVTKGGGLRNTLNGMPRGWNNRRQTFGSAVGGNLYY